MDLIVYILPVVLFIITMIIILALRAEDRKSRSLQTVKEKILSFRNESQQTIVRIQETCHDCTDKINSKKQEAEETMASINASLDNLRNHHRDLASLESVCKSYEIALEKLRLQTEHAESRIKVVQDEVRKAEEVSSVINTFKQDARVIEDNLKAVQVEYKELVAHTNEELDGIAREHEEREKELLSLFSDELSKSREEFGSFIDEIRDDIEERRKGIAAVTTESKAALEEKGQQLEAAFSEHMDSLENKHSQIASDVDASSVDIEKKLAELAAYFDRKKAEAEQDKAGFASDLNAGKTALADLSASLTESLEEKGSETSELIASRQKAHEDSFAELQQELDENGAALKTEISALKNSLTESLASISSRKDELALMLKQEEEQYEAEAKKHHEELSAAVSSALERITSALSAAVSNIDSALGDAKASIATSTEEASSAVDETRKKALLMCEEEKAQLASDESAYTDFCREKLRKIMAEEVDKVDGIFKAMSRTAEESIAALIKRQSDIKETVSLLNQGTSETIAATVDRLQNLQNRLNVSEASLADTQKQVTVTKEELYNLQEENRKLQSEVLQASKTLENEQDKMAEAKRSRMEEEARLVRLKLESEAYEKTKGTQPKSEQPEKKKKASVEMDTFPEDIEYAGDEEEIPLDDDN